MTISFSSNTPRNQLLLIVFICFGCGLVFDVSGFVHPPMSGRFSSLKKMVKLSSALAVTKDDLLGAQKMVDDLIREKACGTLKNIYTKDRMV